MKRRNFVQSSFAGGLTALAVNPQISLANTNSSSVKIFDSADELKTYAFGEADGETSPSIKVCFTASPTSDYVYGAHAYYVPWMDGSDRKKRFKNGEEIPDKGYFAFFDADGNGWILNGTINAKQCGAKGDGITDDSDALNVFFDAAINNRIKMEMHGETYICAKSIKLNYNLQNSNRFSPILDGGNAIIKFVGTNFTDNVCFKVGGDYSGKNNILGSESIVIKNLNIAGPGAEDSSFDSTSVNGSPSNKFIGVVLENILNVRLENIVVSGFWIGMKTHYVWPITADAVKFEGNYIGLLATQDTTSATWTRCRFLSSRYAIILRPNSSGYVYGQQFIGSHFEHCLHGAVLDPNDNAQENSGIFGIHFIGSYVEGIGYENGGVFVGDLLRIGKSISDPENSQLNASDYGSDRNRSVTNVIYSPAVESIGPQIKIRLNSTKGKIKDLEVKHSQLLASRIDYWQKADALSISPGAAGSDFPVIPGKSSFLFYTDQNASVGDEMALHAQNGQVNTVEKVGDGRYRVFLPKTFSNAYDYKVTATLEQLGFVSVTPDVNFFEVKVYDHSGNVGDIETGVYLNIELPS